MSRRRKVYCVQKHLLHKSTNVFLNNAFAEKLKGLNVTRRANLFVGIALVWLSLKLSRAFLS